MKKFEYIVIPVDAGVVEWAKPDEPRHESLMRYLNSLGDEGWEIFECRGDMYAKREKA